MFENFFLATAAPGVAVASPAGMPIAVAAAVASLPVAMAMTVTVAALAALGAFSARRVRFTALRLRTLPLATLRVTAIAAAAGLGPTMAPTRSGLIPIRVGFRVTCFGFGRCRPFLARGRDLLAQLREYFLQHDNRERASLGETRWFATTEINRVQNLVATKQLECRFGSSPRARFGRHA
jgi:hypothetical protein